MIDVNHNIKARLQWIKTVDSHEFGNPVLNTMEEMKNQKWKIKDLVWNCQTPAILWFSRIDRDPRLLSPRHAVPLKKQKNMPDPIGEGLARDEAMNHGQ